MAPTAFQPRKAYAALSVYRGADDPVALDLSDNTNLFGVAPSAVRAVGEGRFDLSRYPSTRARPLVAALAQWLGVDQEQLIVGCGSNDLIDATLRAVGHPGHRVAHPSPTFGMASHFAIANGLVPIPVPAAPDGQADVDALLATGAEIIYLASPNNPTGVVTARDAIDRLLERAPGVVLLDEAYVEFGGSSRVTEAATRGNLVVTRTFSKAWGLAGLRIGYAVATPRVRDEIEKARGPFTLNAIAEVAATEAVVNDRRWLEQVVRLTEEGRTDMLAALASLGLTTWATQANFVAFPFADARWLSDRLLASGVRVRPMAGALAPGDLVRITVGPAAARARVIGLLREVLA